MQKCLAKEKTTPANVCDIQTVEFPWKQTDTMKITSINHLKSLAVGVEQKQKLSLIERTSSCQTKILKKDK